MTFNVIEEDSAALQSVIDGKNDYDFHPIPVDRLGEVQNQYADQLKLYTPANTYYYFMNTRLKPFDKLEVRQAVNYAVDRDAVVRLYGGLAAPTQNVLPPTYPQYKKITTYTHDLAKAKALVQASGYAGMPVTVWGNSRETLQKPARVPGGRPEPDRLQGEAEDHRSVGVLHDDRQPADEGADRNRELVPGLPASAELVRHAPERQPHHRGAQQQLLERQREGDQRRRSRSSRRSPRSTTRSTRSGRRSTRWSADNALWAPVVNRQFTDFFTPQMDLSNCYVSHVLYQYIYATSCKK